MFFEVIPRGKWVPNSGSNIAYLKEDNWDDHGKFQTTFQLTVFDRGGKRYEPSSVKIGETGLLPSVQSATTPPARAPSISIRFDALEDRFFSLGLEENYYEVINALDEEWRLRILVGLRDCAYDLSLFEKYKNEAVMKDSLIRSVPVATLRNKFHRLANGNAALTEFYFEYRFPGEAGSKLPPPLGFHVEPAAEPPNNVHVLIGRNGVGKTRFLQSLVQLLLAANPTKPNWVRLPYAPNQTFPGTIWYFRDW